MPATPGPGERLQDILVDAPLEVTVHDGFEFWLDDEATEDPEVRASLERANASVYPTVRMTAAPAAYWCRVPDRSHVRWVLPDDEDAALNALARLQAAGELTLGAKTKFAGMFRAHGRLVPVWDLPEEPPAEQWEEPFGAFAKRYAEALRRQGRPHRRRAPRPPGPASGGRSRCADVAGHRSLVAHQVDHALPAGSGSRATGHDMQRGPPRPEPSSEPGIRMTSMPARSSCALVSTFRSYAMHRRGANASVLFPSSHCSRSAVTGSRPVSMTRNVSSPIAAAAAVRNGAGPATLTSLTRPAAPASDRP